MFAHLTRTPLLVSLLAATALLCFGPALHALMLRQHGVAQDFFYSGLMLLVIAVLTGIATRSYAPRNVARSQLASLVLGYLLVPLAMALPMMQALPDSRFANVWFEMLSCFTTTGATVYEPERLAPSLHLWRAMAGWFGGFFILLAGFAILAPLNLGGAEVTSGRVPGRGAEGAMQVTRIADPSERVARYALRLLPVYLGLTAALWLGLQVAGMTSLNAAIRAMGTLSTSGILGAEAPAEGGMLAEVMIFVFLFAAVTRHASPNLRAIRREVPVWQDAELRLAIVILGSVTVLLFLRHFLGATAVVEGEAAGQGMSPAQAMRALWGTLYTATSFLTTTGYASADWDAARGWSGLQTPGLILLALAIIGGGVATTAGGVKLLRVYAILRHCERELERIIHPSSVGGGGALTRRLQREGGFGAFVFFMLFATSIGISVGALTILGLDFETALISAIAALTTTGALTGVAAAEHIPLAALSDAAKAVLGLTMIVGRLETLALLALVMPAAWRR